MPLRLDSQSADFPKRFRSLLATKRETAEDVETVVRGIVSDVAARGDKAILECTGEQAKQRWRDESRGRALFERHDQGEMGDRILDRSFEGTYR